MGLNSHGFEMIPSSSLPLQIHTYLYIYIWPRRSLWNIISIENSLVTCITFVLRKYLYNLSESHMPALILDPFTARLLQLSGSLIIIFNINPTATIQLNSKFHTPGVAMYDWDKFPG